MNRDVAISGLGAVTAAGTTPDELFDALLARKSFFTDDFAGLAAYAVPPPVAEVLGTKGVRTLPRDVRMFLCAALPAADGLDSVARDRIGVVCATLDAGLGEYASVFRATREEGRVGANPALAPYTGFNAVTAATTIRLGARGPGLTLSSGPAAGLEALIAGAGMVADGTADAVIAGGVDVLTEMHPKTSGPTTPGEAAAALTLTPADQGSEFVIAATAATTAVPGDITGLRDAAREAITRTGASAGAVLANATGDPAVDTALASAIRDTLGASVPVAAVAGTTGNARGADGALLALTAVLALERDVVPPVATLTDPTLAGLPRPLGEPAVLCLAAEPDGRVFTVLLRGAAR
ncbi:3-oxoacyl-[acyl-carrier-protein] synthase II [Amycolatopsis xylanica]|uniref:3-oxoacyl-[acyl-carrier-protein] synthase II n=1 Tax=Amycolatopsis xylanica TaxID=589385 RepID=A0A1H2UDS3_9PSEU|nr:beta-ketoacyl synthase N-terminal-like domain-containing protein [Amycolatopsis xylanica]SDW54266.1 3-oxoacyl-[acyl-carrier-protein] synthase II [Amycolatopsis xylanica]